MTEAVMIWLTIVSTLQFLALLFALMWVKRLKSSVITNVRSFLESPKEGEPSPIAVIGDTLASRLGSAIVASLKAWLLAQNSIAVRQDKAAMREAMQQDNPVLGMLAKFSPGIGKLLGKNPELAQIAINALTRGNKAISSESGNHQGEFNKI